jgi:hypothetical protein
MKIWEVGQLIGQIVTFAVCVVEEVIDKPKAGEEKRPVAIQIIKDLVNRVVADLPISDLWKKILTTVINWDFVAGFLVDKAVQTLNDLGIFKKSS